MRSGDTINYMQRKSLKVLLVEDDSELRSAMKSALGRNGYEIFVATGGHSAYETATKVSIDLIVSDVDMPEGSGLWLIENLRKSKNLTPVILMSGGSISEEQAASVGAVALLRKPFQSAFLPDVIRDLATQSFLSHSLRKVGQ